MPLWTTPLPGSVGQRIKAGLFNLAVNAILELQAAVPGVTQARPQLRVYAPASVTSGAVVPYATIGKDSHSGWNSGTRKYTVPVAGLYHFAAQWKCSSPGVVSNLCLIDNATGNTIFAGPNSSGGNYTGFPMSGCVDLTAGQVVYMKELTASYTPFNDTTGSGGTGSNYFHLTYLGPST